MDNLGNTFYKPSAWFTPLNKSWVCWANYTYSNLTDKKLAWGKKILIIFPAEF